MRNNTKAIITFFPSPTKHSKRKVINGQFQELFGPSIERNALIRHFQGGPEGMIEGVPGTISLPTGGARASA